MEKRVIGTKREQLPRSRGPIEDERRSALRGPRVRLAANRLPFVRGRVLLQLAIDRAARRADRIGLVTQDRTDYPPDLAAADHLRATSAMHIEFGLGNAVDDFDCCHVQAPV